MARSTIKKRKRSFGGNQYTDKNKIKRNDNNVPPPSCASQRKLQCDPHETEAKNNDNYNVIIDFSILKDIVACISKCPCCKSGDLKIINDLDKRYGFCYLFFIRCTACLWEKSFRTSKRCISPESPARSNTSFAVNVQMAMSFRELGKGHTSVNKFTGLMNMPPCISSYRYNMINDQLHNAYAIAAEISTQRASDETHKLISSKLPELQTIEVKESIVSFDGTWQKRGHASINGVVTAISSANGKCLDTHVMSKNCKGCVMWNGKENQTGYAEWYSSHQCTINHIGSSGSMEATGVLEMYKRSVKKHSLMYTKYLGDGDTSSFNEVVAAKPYGEDVVIQKLECIGHIQKRVGTRCRNLRQSHKGTRLSDGKYISGRGRLTDKAINTLQNYFGMAVRQNTENLYAMKKSILATLFHNCAFEDETVRHQYCPRSADSWCLWQSDKVTKQVKYKKKLSLPLTIKALLVPIFKDLSSDELLSKCLHGQTQNNNESINNVIWKKCPKTTYVSRKVLEIAVNAAVVEFNDGMCGIKTVFEQLGLYYGRFVDLSCREMDKTRIRLMTDKSSVAGKLRRKKLRAKRKGFQDKEKEEEKVPSYSTGSF